jgi:hypothetical protein
MELFLACASIFNYISAPQHLKQKAIFLRCQRADELKWFSWNWVARIGAVAAKGSGDSLAVLLRYSISERFAGAVTRLDGHADYGAGAANTIARQYSDYMAHHARGDRLRLRHRARRQRRGRRA